MEKFKQRVQVRNLGPLKEIDLELDKLVVFIGQQASGKSTLAKLIYFFKGIDDVVFKLSTELTTDPYELRSYLELEIHNALTLSFTRLFGSTLYMQGDFSAKFYYTKSNYLELKLNTEKELQLQFSESFTKGIYAFFLNIASMIQGGDYESASGIHKNWSKTIGDNRSISYVPAGRNIVVTFTKYFQQLLLSNRKQSGKSLTASPFTGSNEFLILEFMKEVSYFLEDYRGGGFEELAAKYQALTGKPNPYKSLALSKINTILRGEYKNNGDEVLTQLGPSR